MCEESLCQSIQNNCEKKSISHLGFQLNKYHRDFKIICMQEWKTKSRNLFLTSNRFAFDILKRCITIMWTMWSNCLSSCNKRCIVWYASHYFIISSNNWTEKFTALQRPIWETIKWPCVVDKQVCELATTQIHSHPLYSGQWGKEWKEKEEETQTPSRGAARL